MSFITVYASGQRSVKTAQQCLVGRVQGMMKAFQEAKPDLVNWLRPKLKVKRKTENERRVVERRSTEI